MGSNQREHMDLEEVAMDRFAIDEIAHEAALRTPVIDLMARHVSVRAFDPDRALPEGLTTVLMTAAQSAATSSNLQNWSVVEVRDPERKLALQEMCGYQTFISQAPLFLIFCADSYRIKWVTRRQGYRFNADYLDLLLVACMDSALACQNATLAAESLGLGCCMVGNIRNRPQEVSDLLELPQGVFATIGLAVGYAARRNPVKPRLPHRVVLHRERYSTEHLEEGVDDYDAHMMETTIYHNRRVEVPDLTPPPEEDTAPYGWSEHSARRMARGNGLRRGLGTFLKAKGFVLE